ncbi:SDR family NAD(P)-dependent oxidoreductase [Halomontanus rarus]|uniref:SDR family NAD(P)-dependent oxidoreductase n=1 Tax=Halomontanus rarus TaxID=3034020 RepID=UPI0023E8761A|nr:SDR family NAD(P)-dependent oxidoreductase [Halovivax sp. TS33]
MTSGDRDRDHDLENETVLLTGGTSGIGRIAAGRLAERGATVAIVGRNGDRGVRIADELTAETTGTVGFHRADLAERSAVRALADDVLETYDRLDVLVHNAGLSSRTRTETADGVELTFAVNHLAPYLLTHDLLDRLRESAPSRIVVTASGIHGRAGLEFEVEDGRFAFESETAAEYDALEAYARSKLANVAFTVELADRLEREGEGEDESGSEKELTANCFHPGFVPSTGLFRDAPLWTRAAMRVVSAVPGVGSTPAAGADRLVRLATAPEFGDRTGVYVGSGGVEAPAPQATDPTVRTRLWTRSADLVGVDPQWP